MCTNAVQDTVSHSASGLVATCSFAGDDSFFCPGKPYQRAFTSRDSFFAIEKNCAFLKKNRPIAQPTKLPAVEEDPGQARDTAS